MTLRCLRSTHLQSYLINLYIGVIGVLLEGMHYFCTANKCCTVTITAGAILRHFLIWRKMVRQPATCWYHCFFFNTSLFFNKTKNPQHLDCGRLIPTTHGDKIIPDSAEQHLEWFHPHLSQVSLQHQGVVDSYHFHCWNTEDTTVLHFNSLMPSEAIWRHRSGSTLAQVMACCLTAPSHYLNQCWLIISKV